MRRVLSLTALVLLLPLTAAAQEAPASSQPSDAVYRVGPADELRITVFDEPALTGTFRVDVDGSIAYPLIGRVEVAGKTVREIEETITKRLLDGYVRAPRVSVEISQYRSRSVFIMGEVRTPGKYALEGNVTLLEALALAGALTDAAGDVISIRRPIAPAQTAGPSLPQDSQSAEVLRVSIADLQAGRAAANIVLQDGDTIFVPPAPRIFVTGHVKNPGPYVLRGRLTVQQAIAMAGGFTERGSDRGIKIRREVAPGQFVEIEVKLTDFVEPGDTIIVRQRYI
jgi:polysaccharide export outer membrane protein